MTRPPFDYSDVDTYATDVEYLQRQLRRALEQKARAFSQGYTAALEAVEQGASVEEIRSLVEERVFRDDEITRPRVLTRRGIGALPR